MGHPASRRGLVDVSQPMENADNSEPVDAARRLLVGGDPAGALRVLDGARTALPAALTMRAFILARLGDRAAALLAARAAVQTHPTGREASLMLANLLLDGAAVTQARQAVHRGLIANPECAPLWRALAGAMPSGDASALDRRAAALRRALLASPRDRQTRRALAAHLAECSARARFAGDVPKAIGTARAAIRIDATQEAAWAALMYANQCIEERTPEAAYADAVAAGKAIAGGTPPVARRPRLIRSGPLDLAILAATLSVSSVWFFLAPLLDGHDTHMLSITLYDNAPEQLEIDRARVRTVSLGGLAPDAIAERVAAGGHDVVFDVMGFGHYGSRLRVLAARPAPYALTGIGYPGTLGIDAVDWKLGDRLIHPAGGAERLHEQLLVLPHMLCYQPPAHAPQLRDRPPGAPLRLGSFNQLNKIGPTCLEAWRLTLAAVPDAQLIVKRPEIAGREDLLRARFAAHGLPMDRVRLEGGEVEHMAHLARYAGIDIALDTYPYNGTTTTCEALWMGVPVVSLVGDHESSRTGLSLLTAAGMPENAVDGPLAYAERVRALAEDRAGLAEFRRDARDRLGGTALLDKPGYSRSFATALTSAVRERDDSTDTRYQS